MKLIEGDVKSLNGLPIENMETKFFFMGIRSVCLLFTCLDRNLTLLAWTQTVYFQSNNLCTILMYVSYRISFPNRRKQLIPRLWHTEWDISSDKMDPRRISATVQKRRFTRHKSSRPPFCVFFSLGLMRDIFMFFYMCCDPKPLRWIPINSPDLVTFYV